MKRLYLVRHAKSSWEEPELPDKERPLNTRGKRDAPFMGKQLKKCKVKPEVIISSPAKRALDTARIIAKAIRFPALKIEIDRSAYQANISTLLKTVRNIKASSREAILVGHNPELTEFSRYLTGSALDTIPTCGIFCADFKGNSWKSVGKNKGTLVFFHYPKQYPQLKDKKEEQ